MSIDKNSSTIITLEKAKKFTENFRNNFQAETKAYFVGSNQLKLILEQDKCIGLRIYNGYNQDEKIKNLVLVGVDKNKKDMNQGYILEELITCPPICDEDSILLNN